MAADADRRKHTDVKADLTAERDQLWAEAVERWKEGETLYLPTNQRGNISESNRPLREAKGVTMQGGADGCTILQLEQGSYTFQY